MHVEKDRHAFFLSSSLASHFYACPSFHSAARLPLNPNASPWLLVHDVVLIPTMLGAQTAKPLLGSKPVLTFAGDLFETKPELMTLKSLLIDVFRGEVVDNVNIGACLGDWIAQGHSMRLAHLAVFILRSRN